MPRSDPVVEVIPVSDADRNFKFDVKRVLPAATFGERIIVDISARVFYHDIIPSPDFRPVFDMSLTVEDAANLARQIADILKEIDES